MDLLIPLIILAVLVAVFGSNKGKGRRKRTRAPGKSTKNRVPAKRIADREPKPDPYLFLYDRWKKIEAGEIKVPNWYQDPVTEAQLKRLKEDGTKLPGRTIAKGQASDLIELSEPPGPTQIEILKFFKVTGLPLKHQMIALSEIDRLLEDPDNRSLWENRPATPDQKEYYRYFSLPIPKGLSARDANTTISKHELSEQQEEEWHAYSEIFEEFQDKDFRESYDLKKPSSAIIRQAINRHIDKGEKITDLMADDLVETILDIKPDLEKI